MKSLATAFLSLALTASSFAASGGVSVAVTDGSGKPLPDAVVSLIPLDTALPPAVPSAADAKPVEIAQIGEQYRPFVTVVRTGTRVEFPNKDEVQHHIYSVSKAKRFEKPLYESGSSESVLFDQPGVITLGCNIHDWMVAYVLVVDTAYFAKSDAAGLGSVTGLPPGRYTLDIWHPRITKPDTREIVVAAGGVTEASASLALKPDRRIRRAPSGEGGKAY